MKDKLYHFYGCHKVTDGYLFRVYAPNAKSVSVVGTFNNWDPFQNIMENHQGTFALVIKEAKQYDQYKYLIHTKNKSFYKADPFAFFSEHANNHNSIIYDLHGYTWHDEKWIQSRKHLFSNPVNIYEVHLGSWKGKSTYRELAKELIPYVKEMGFTHLELLPITEHPYDGSWGYQVSGYYSVTSRYGEPKDFMAFVDEAHQQGLGVIIDWVPGHFPKDDYGLIEFDGTFLYEDSDELKQEHKRWGTRVFDYGKRWVKQFLIENAHFFYDVYHIDGIRVDAVASMLYLDYDRTIWRKNKDGGNYHYEAISFIQELNKSIYQEHPYAMMIAEESTAFPKVTSPVHHDGLGFSYKWNMGWMNDTLSYMSNKQKSFNNMTFSFTYAYSENFILPISHDEVVHEKKSLLNKMEGTYDEKFQNIRLYYGYMMTHPGKKLSFMGNEFAQFDEWNHSQGLDWHLLKFPRHFEMQRYYHDLNHFYLQNSALWELDYQPEGFLWVTGEELLIFHRFNRCYDDLLVVLNFQNRNINYHLKTIKNYTLVFNSDEIKYGGNGYDCNVSYEDGILSIFIPALTCLIFKGEIHNKD